MNVRLQYNLEFPGAIYFEDQLQLNFFSVNLSLTTTTSDRYKINVAMERLRCFVNSELANAVYINQKQQDIAEVMQMLGMNMVTLPEDPVDQIVGLMLYCKLNAIMEGVLIVTSIDINSTLGDGVWFQHDEEDAVGPFADNGWWNDPTITHNNINLVDTDSKVVEVRSSGWHEYGLLWPEDNSKKEHTVVYAEFQKNAN
jgi:hypothetical protein